MRIAAVFLLGSLLLACAGEPDKEDPSVFRQPEDCNNPDKRSHPDYLDACRGSKSR